jgi:hypothetical protein
VEGLGGDMAKKISLVVIATLILLQKPASATILGGELFAPSSLHSLITEKSPITVEVGFEYLHPDFPSINNVLVENQRTSFSNKTGNVENSYPDVFAQTLKVQAVINEANLWTASLKTYLPLNALAQLDSGYIYQPEFVLYRAEAQRPRILFATAMNLDSDWRVGIAADVGFSMTAQANVFLQGGADKYSDQRITAKLKPSIVPQASVQFQNYVFAVRAENKAPFELGTAATAQVFGPINAGVSYDYTSQSSLYFQPWEFEFSGKNRVSPLLAVKWGLSYQLWSGYQARAALIKGANADCSQSGGNPCNSNFSGSLAPAFQARNLFVPEAGLEFQIGNNRYDIGYRFKDSIFKGLPTDNGNYLDPPRHDVMLGVTFPTKSGWEWHVNTQVSRLVSQTVVKSDTGEIGAPGYTASGWLYGGSASVAIPFNPL